MDAVDALDREIACEMLITLASDRLYGRGAHAEALALADKAIHVARESGSRVQLSRALHLLALVQQGALEIDASLVSLHRARRAAEHARDAGSLLRAMQRQAMPLFLLGRLDDLDLLLEDLRALDGKAVPTGERSIPMAVELALQSARGHTGTIDDTFAAIVTTMQSTGYMWALNQTVSCYVGTMVRIGDGSRAQQAVQLLASEQSRASRSSQRLIDLLMSGIDLLAETPRAAAQLPGTLRPPDAFNALAINDAVIAAEIGIAHTNQAALEFATEVLSRAFRAGVLLSPFWPGCVPKLLARCSALLGRNDDAVYLHRVADEFLARQKLAI